MPSIGLGISPVLPWFGVRDPFLKYLGANGETIDESNKGYTSEQIDYAISIFATCTNCTIDISGTNAHRTAASNDDLNTVLANGNTITLNDVLGAELHTSLNAANDSATQAVTAFSDYAATIDGATKVDSAIDFLSMIPQGSEEVTNGDFATDSDWTKNGWTIGGGVASAAGLTTQMISDTASFTIGKYYVAVYTVLNYSSGSVRIEVGNAGTGASRSANGTYTEVIRCKGSTVLQIDGLTAFTGDVDNVSVKELQVLGSDLVTNGDFTLGADLQTSNCANGAGGLAYGTFANGTPNGFDAISDGSATHLAGTADEVTFVNTQKYVVTFDLVLNSGTAPLVNFFAGGGVTSRTVEGYSTSAAGTNVFEFTANATDTVELSFYNVSTATDYEITNLSVKDADTDWVYGDGAIAYGGTANVDGSQGGSSQIYQLSTMVDESAYLYKFTVSGYSAGNVRIFAGGVSSWFSANGTYTILMVNSAYAHFNIGYDADFIGDIDNVSVHKLTFQKEIAESTNYDGTHYVLPVDENDFAIPVDYVAEGIVAQVFGGESNATAGWSVDNNALITSVAAPVSVGEFALNIESNTTPTASARATTVFNVDNAAVYRFVFDLRHIGVGDSWFCNENGNLFNAVSDSDITYTTIVRYFVAPDTSTYLRFQEANPNEDGGVVVDNLSLKKVTLV